MSGPVRVCFVCTGNICRSPVAAAVLASVAAETALPDGRVLADVLDVTSAGTGSWHAGGPMDPRALGALAARGYPNPRHVARQFERSWFAELDLVVGLARRHTQTLTSLGGASVAPGQVALLSSYLRGAPADIADPYYGDDADFDACLAAIEPCVAALAAHLVETEPWRRADPLLSAPQARPR